MKLVTVQRLNPEYDEPAICERCGAPIANVYVVDDGGEEHVFGSTCIRSILPKSPRWFELFLEIESLGVAHLFGGLQAMTAMDIHDLRAILKVCDILSERRPTMDTQDLLRNLEFVYYSICAANPDYEVSLWDFLKSRGVDNGDIWEYSPEIGRDVGKEEPDWL